MRRFAAAALSLLMAGCVSAPPPGPNVIDLPPVSIEQMRGRSQGEVRRLFDASLRDESALFDVAQVIDGVQVVRIGGNDIFATTNPCPDHYTLSHVRARVGEQQQSIDAFVFRDQRFDGLVGGLNQSGPLSADSVVIVQCRRMYDSTSSSNGVTADDVIYGAGVLVFFAPVLSVAVAASAVGSLFYGSDGDAHSLGDLRLGAPLEGGADAYASENPRTVTIVDRQGERITLYVALARDDLAEDRELMSVIVESGIVQDVRAPAIWTCRLAPNGAIQCAR